MKIIKKVSSLALVSAHNQRMATIDVIFERYERILDEKNNIFLLLLLCVCIY